MSTQPRREPEQSGRILGLDVGERRVGVAVSDELGVVASPIGYIPRGPGDRDALRALIERYAVGRLVVGLPRGLSGREGPQAADVRAYADELATDIGLPIEYWDERLTTAIAERSLIESGTRRKQRRERVDAVAAAIMLQDYLDAQRQKRSGAKPW
ncbi:MAG: Holliday junction resolvase RuvX [Chloroflexota bacterium]